MDLLQRGLEFYSSSVVLKDPSTFEHFKQITYSKEKHKIVVDFEKRISQAAKVAFKQIYATHFRFIEANSLVLKRHPFFDFSKEETLPLVQEVVNKWDTPEVVNSELVRRVYFTLPGEADQNIVKFLVFFIQRLGQKRIHLFLEDYFLKDREALKKNLVICNHLGIDVIIESANVPLQTDVLLFYISEGKTSIFPSDIIFRLFLTRVFNTHLVIDWGYPYFFSSFLMSSFPEFLPDCFIKLFNLLGISETMEMICNYLRHITGEEDISPHKLSQVVAVDLDMMRNIENLPSKAYMDDVYRKERVSNLLKSGEFLLGNWIVEFTEEDLDKMRNDSMFLEKLRTVLFFTSDVVFSCESNSWFSEDNIEFLGREFAGYPVSMLIDSSIERKFSVDALKQIILLCNKHSVPLVLGMDIEEKHIPLFDLWLKNVDIRIEIQPFSKVIQKITSNLIGFDLKCSMIENLFNKLGASYNRSVDVFAKTFLDYLGPMWVIFRDSEECKECTI